MQEKIPYKVIDEDKGYKLIKVNSKMHLFYMNSRGNQFMMERDFFDYLDGNAIPYAILCHDTSKNIFYYLVQILNIFFYSFHVSLHLIASYHIRSQNPYFMRLCATL